jgi:hypothetical protein
VEEKRVLRAEVVPIWAVWVVLGFFVVALVGGWADHARGHTSLRSAVDVTVLTTPFIALLALAVWRLPRGAVEVTVSEVRVLRGTRVHRRLRWDEVSEVRPFRSRGRPAVLLRGPGGRVLLSARALGTIDPALEALAPVVAARPGLLRDDYARELFWGFLADLRPA